MIGLYTRDKRRSSERAARAGIRYYVDGLPAILGKPLSRKRESFDVQFAARGFGDRRWPE
jgi:hypothetical protein